ncbi:two-component system, response regulator YesN [Paenibacillus sp. yr247]|uniref:response regulator transcription factor n=1 Tax=Paenibacillus sp. yr247 TaxID=1761880 RepID=UPI00089031C1|nr:response regulator [Paenibacillus sp. yr247]SDM83035.1 two-component system, response regulator YesN [Paenibacillus sp. yr247]
MYRVLIVDDEPVIRNGIKAFINWEREGLTATADCANGMEALSLMESLPVDILITDIKMPLMNGIQLMQHSLQLYPHLKVIMVSSYTDFEFVREGLKLGAVDYLLKPTLEAEDLLAVLRRCIASLEEEKKRQSKISRSQLDAVYRDQRKFEHELKRLIVLEQECDYSWVPGWMKDRITCVYMMLDDAQELREIHGNLHTQLLLEDLQESFYTETQEGVAALVTSDNSLFLLLPKGLQEVEPLLLQWKQLLARNFGVSITLGICSLQGIHEIRHGFAESRHASQERFFQGLGKIFSANAAQGLPRRQQDAEIDETPDWAALAEQIRGRTAASNLIKQVHNRWSGGRLDPARIKHEACSLLTETCQNSVDLGTLPEQLDHVRSAETLEQLEGILSRLFEEFERGTAMNLPDKGYSGKLITKALSYMNTHYTEDLTLQSTADAVHVSKSYFSLLFKKQTGQNFIDYLIDLRVREAKRLLVLNDFRIYEVAEAAGFNDVKYFSKLFKKMTGFTPVEFREKHQTSK